jgi:hypothetical protein
LQKKGDFKKNFVQSSGFIFFDIDNIGNLSSVENFKQEFIEKYGQLVSLVSKSVSGRGISILVRVSNNISTEEDYYFTYDYIKQTYFNSFKLDDSVRRTGCAWFIPLDEDVYCNYSSVITIPITLTEKKVPNEVLIKQPQHIHQMVPAHNDNKVRNYSDLLEKYYLETRVEFEGQFLIKPVSILSIRFPNKIFDGKKHSVYRKVIHNFMEINPGVEYTAVLVLISHINDNFATPPMNYNHLKNLVKSQYDYIRNKDGYINTSKKSIRIVHYRDRGSIPFETRNHLSKKLNGFLQRSLTWKKIQYAKNYLLDEHDTFTYKEISSLIGMSESSVKRTIKIKKSELEKEFKIILDDIEKVVNTFSLPN